MLTMVRVTARQSWTFSPQERLPRLRLAPDSTLGPVEATFDAEAGDEDRRSADAALRDGGEKRD